MKILVDTSVWSDAFRRNHPVKGRHVLELTRLIEEGDAAMIGPVRQELLSGIPDAGKFLQVKQTLASFPDEVLDSEDFENGAKCFNACRSKGIQGAHTDFLICAFAMRHEMPIFTVDKDFKSFAKVLPITLHVAKSH